MCVWCCHNSVILLKGKTKRASQLDFGPGVAESNTQEEKPSLLSWGTGCVTPQGSVAVDDGTLVNNAVNKTK